MELSNSKSVNSLIILKATKEERGKIWLTTIRLLSEVVKIEIGLTNNKHETVMKPPQRF